MRTLMTKVSDHLGIYLYNSAEHYYVHIDKRKSEFNKPPHTPTLTPSNKLNPAYTFRRFMLMFRISLLYHRGAKTNLLILSDVISVQIRLLGIAGVRSLLMARYK